MKIIFFPKNEKKAYFATCKTKTELNGLLNYLIKIKPLTVVFSADAYREAEKIKQLHSALSKISTIIKTNNFTSIEKYDY